MAQSQPKPKMDETSYMSVDAAAQDISDELKANASVAVDTNHYGIVRATDVGTDESEGVVILYTRDSSYGVYPREITGIEAASEFGVGDRVMLESGTTGIVTGINETMSHMTDRAVVLEDGIANEASVSVGGLTLVRTSDVECAGDDCRQPATEEIDGCVLGDLNYSLRVCKSCAEQASRIRTQEN